MIDADLGQFHGKYRDALSKAFIDRKILAASAVEATAPAHVGKRRKQGAGRTTAVARKALSASLAPAMSALFPISHGRPAEGATHRVAISPTEIGLTDKPVVVHVPVEQKRFVTVAAAVHAEIAQSSQPIDSAVRRFIKMLVSHDRIESPRQRMGVRAKPQKGTGPEQYRKTHVIVQRKEGLVLVRQRFRCGCTR